MAVTRYSREKVLDVVARALLLDPERGEAAAIEATAQALGLPVEAVREVVEAREEQC